MVIWDKEGHYLKIKRSIHQEDVIIINTYALNIGTPKYFKQILTDMKGETVWYNNNRGLQHPTSNNG